MNKNNDGKNNNKCSSSINLTIKFRDATNSIRDELLPPECLLLIQKKDKSIKKVVESDVYTLSNDDKHEQRAVFDSLPASPTSPFSPQTPSSQESMSLSPHNRFVGNNSKVGSVDYTTQLHQLCAMSSSNLDIIQM